MSDTVIRATIEIYDANDSSWLLIAGELFGPYKNQDDAIDAIPACLRSLP